MTVQVCCPAYTVAGLLDSAAHTLEAASRFTSQAYAMALYTDRADCTHELAKGAAQCVADAAQMLDKVMTFYRREEADR